MQALPSPNMQFLKCLEQLETGDDNIVVHNLIPTDHDHDQE